MTGSDEKDRRLTNWYELLSNTVMTGSRDAWHRELRREAARLNTQGLIDAGEAYELRKLADAAFKMKAL